MAFVVRRIRPDEGEDLKALRLAALRDAPDAFEITHAAEAAKPADWWDDVAARRSEGSVEAMFVAESDRRLVGLAGGYLEDGCATTHLVSMWTAPAARRQGVARALIAAVVAWAEEAGADGMDLWVTVGNDPARLLYDSAGFELTSDSKPLVSNPSKVEVRMFRPLR